MQVTTLDDSKVILLTLVFDSHCTTGCPLPPPPTLDGYSFWSLNTTWPSGVVPVAGASVTILSNMSVIMDVSPPALATLTIQGRLKFLDDGSVYVSFVISCLYRYCCAAGVDNVAIVAVGGSLPLHLCDCAWRVECHRYQKLLLRWFWCRT